MSINTTKMIKEANLINTSYEDDVAKASAAEYTSRIKYNIDNVNIKDEDQVKALLSFLDTKISASRKTLSFWDVYAIRDIATTRDEVAKKKAALPINSSLVIGKQIELDGHTYHTGDMIVKTNYGETIDVLSQQTGFYKPKDKITKVGDTGNTYQLTFEYAQQGDSTDDISVEMDTSNLNAPVGLYSVYETLDGFDSKVEVPLIDGVKPVWEIRIQGSTDNEIGEQIYNAVEVKYDTTNSKYVFTNKSSLSLVVLAK